jgi:hypothetical protein
VCFERQTKPKCPGKNGVRPHLSSRPRGPNQARAPCSRALRLVGFAWVSRIAWSFQGPFGPFQESPGTLLGVKWRDKFWSRRYRAIVVSDEEAAQVERLQYVLSQGVKEGLVEKSGQWPGVHCLKALLEGVPLVGQWFDRTREYAAQQRNEKFKRLDYATSYEVQLSPLPCWKDLTPEQRRERIAVLVRESDAEAAERRAKTGKQPLGPAAVLQQQPHATPMTSKKSPAPLFHAASKRVRDELYSLYWGFVGAFREASERWRAGDRSVVFPGGCFPPAPGFVDA